MNNLQTQLTAVQAAIEGSSQASIFKPRPFTGALNEDINEWLAKFDRFARFYNWGAAKKLGAVVLLFEGPALSWFQTLPDEKANNYNELVEELKKRFGATSIDFVLRQELYSRKQGQSESLINYTEDIIKRCQRLSLSDIDLMNIFINGLSPELKSHVVLNQPKTFAEAENLAHLRDAVLKASGPASLNTIGQSHQDQRIKELEGQVNLLLSLATKDKSSNQQPLHAIACGPTPSRQYFPPQIDQPFNQFSGNNDVTVSQFKSELIAALQEVSKGYARPQRPNQGRPSSYNRNNGAPRGRNLRTTDGQPICNYCQRVGHVARYCQQRNNQANFQPHFPQSHSSFLPRSQPRFQAQPPAQQNLNGNGPSNWGN